MAYLKNIFEVSSFSFSLFFSSLHFSSLLFTSLHFSSLLFSFHSFSHIPQGWSPDVHAILDATTEDEIQQRDLYDRPPSVRKPWTKGNVALLGDSVHAMMPNLGQGGCQAIEDALVLTEELGGVTDRKQIEGVLNRYRERRLVRSAAVQGLSR